MKTPVAAPRFLNLLPKKPRTEVRGICRRSATKFRSVARLTRSHFREDLLETRVRFKTTDGAWGKWLSVVAFAQLSTHHNLRLLQDLLGVPRATYEKVWTVPAREARIAV